MFPYIVFEGLRIPSYGLCMTLAIILCSTLCINKACKLSLLFDDLIVIIAVSVGVGLLFSYLLYIFVTYPVDEIFNYITSRDFSFIKNGGLVFYGGLIGGIFGAVITSRLLHVDINVLEMCVVPYIPLGHAIGRIGCMMAGCCHGFEYYGLFALSNNSIDVEKMFFPTQIIESICNILIMSVLLLYVKKRRAGHTTLLLYLTMYSIIRFVLEFCRADQIRGVFFNLSTSQWLSVFILVFCIFYRVYRIKTSDIYFCN